MRPVAVSTATTCLCFRRAVRTCAPNYSREFQCETTLRMCNVDLRLFDKRSTIASNRPQKLTQNCHFLTFIDDVYVCGWRRGVVVSSVPRMNEVNPLAG